MPPPSVSSICSISKVKRLWFWVLAATLLSSCYGPDPNLTESGQGRPTIDVEFPSSVAPGSVHDMEVTVDNPGPGDLSILSVSFTLVGVAGEPQPPDPLIQPGTKGRSVSVVSVEPVPGSVSEDGTVFQFGDTDAASTPGPFLAEGSSASLTFRVRIPDRTGLLANSVTAYDGREPTRARGVLVKTEVEADAG